MSIRVNLLLSHQSDIRVIFINPEITYEQLFRRVSHVLIHAEFSLKFLELLSNDDLPVGGSPLSVMLATDDELQVFLNLAHLCNNILQLNVTVNAIKNEPTSHKSADYGMKVASAGDNKLEFLRAARSGDVGKVGQFLQEGMVTSVCNANGLNALHLASYEGHAHVVRLLLERGAAVNASTIRGNTALHIASLAGHDGTVKTLLDRNAAVNVRSQNGLTPLYMAAQNNHVTIVKQLLEHHADPFLTTHDGFSPFDVAFQQGHQQVTAILPVCHSSRGYKNRSASLHVAAARDGMKTAPKTLDDHHDDNACATLGVLFIAFCICASFYV